MFNDHYVKLKVEAKKLGYETLLLSNTYGTAIVYHLNKYICITKKSGEVNSIFEFAHEIGHCLQFRKIWNKLNCDEDKVKDYYREKNKSKTLFLWDEVDAWIKGYFILKRNSIDTKGYIQHASHCVKSHSKRSVKKT